MQSSFALQPDIIITALKLFAISMLTSIYLMYLIVHPVQQKIYTILNPILQILSWLGFCAGIATLIYITAQIS